MGEQVIINFRSNDNQLVQIKDELRGFFSSPVITSRTFRDGQERIEVRTERSSYSFSVLPSNVDDMGEIKILSESKAVRDGLIRSVCQYLDRKNREYEVKEL